MPHRQVTHGQKPETRGTRTSPFGAGSDPSVNLSTGTPHHSQPERRLQLTSCNNGQLLSFLELVTNLAVRLNMTLA